MGAVLTSTQVLLIMAAIFLSVMATCFVLSRFNVLPSLANGGGRYTHIDGLRGLAALGVFMCHTSVILMIVGINDIYFHFKDIQVSGKLGSTGVQIFFCITAFLFTQKILHSKTNMDWGQFYTHRVRRIAPLYFLVATVAVLFAVIIHQTPADFGHTFISWLTAYGFWFVPMKPIYGFDLHWIIGNTWTLEYEWTFYLLMPVFFWLLKDKLWKKVLPAIIVLAVIDLSASQMAQWAFFIGGVLAALLLNKFQIQQRKWRWLCISLAIIVIAIPISNHCHYYGLLSWVCLTSGFILLMLGEPSVLKLKTLRYLGEISYSFYLWGLFLAYVVFYVLKVTGTPGHLRLWGFLRWEIILSVGLVVLSTLTFRFVEYPFLRRNAGKKLAKPVVAEVELKPATN